MVAIAVLGVLLAIAVPNFRSVIQGNRLSAGSNELLAALQFARMESIRRNVRVTVCQSGDGLTCTTSGNWAGWLVFADENRNNTPNGNEPLRMARTAPSVIVRDSAAITSDRFNFYPDGLARTGVAGSALLNARIRTCVTGTSVRPNARDVAIVAGSRMSVLQVSDNSTCTATVPNS